MFEIKRYKEYPEENIKIKVKKQRDSLTGHDYNNSQFQ